MQNKLWNWFQNNGRSLKMTNDKLKSMNIYQWETVKFTQSSRNFGTRIEIRPIHIKIRFWKCAKTWKIWQIHPWLLSQHSFKILRISRKILKFHSNNPKSPKLIQINEFREKKKIARIIWSKILQNLKIHQNLKILPKLGN